MLFKKKTKLEFLCAIPHIIETMPMIPAKQVRHEWMTKMVMDFAALRKKPGFGIEKMTHTSRCPGIITAVRTGWILRAWQDIYLERSDDDGLIWRTPLDQRNIMGIDSIEVHPSYTFSDYFNHWDSPFSGVIKYQSPWSVIVPEGYYLMEIPVAYADDPRFETVIGYLSPEYGYVPLNPQFIWRTQEKSILIEKGTPIAQYVLVKREEVDMTMRAHTEEERQRYTVLLYSRFVKNMREFKQEARMFFGASKK